MQRIFVSSTVYDLLDVRAEVECWLRERGALPVLSGSVTADFSVERNCNSIETCLANVRNSDAIVVILCRRYGPSLSSVGYGDRSATHLEYDEAVHKGLPVYLYIRDRLEADYAVWKKNKKRDGIELPWLHSASDRPLLHLIDKHRRLAGKEAGSNWFDTFKDSCDLKRLMSRDLGATLARAALTDEIAAGNVPCIDVRLTWNQADQAVWYRFDFVNIGKTAAYSLDCKLNTGLRPSGGAAGISFKHPCLMPQQSTNQSFATHLTETWRADLDIRYTLPSGHVVEETHEYGARYFGSGIGCGGTLKSRVYRISDTEKLPIEIVN